LIKKRIQITALALFVCWVTSGYAQSVNVPLDHWAYEFLNRLEIQGGFRGFYLRTLPISRQEVAEILAQVEESRSKNKINLSAAEQDLLEQLKGEFGEELASLNLKSQQRYAEKHLLTWQENNSQIKIDADFRQRFDVERGSRYDSTGRSSLTTLGGIIRGNLKGSLGFYIHFKNTLIRGQGITSENFNPALGLPITISGKNVYQDDASAYFTWKFPWFNFEFGRDEAKWGPGIQGSLMLSAQNPLFDMFRIRTQYKRFQFTSLHGRLSSDEGRKYLAAHRLELRIAPWLFIAGSEAIIYGNRSAELQYLNPIMPYHVAEHHLGDKDNNAMGFDFTLFPGIGHKLYGEFFLDDFTMSENPFRYYGNKFAVLLGYHWVNPFRLKNVDLKTEYTRVEPYVYTHHVPINVYKNYDRIIGHWLGPNADASFFEISYRFNRDLTTSIITERIRSGEGDVDIPHKEEDGTIKAFLSGIVESKWRFGFSITDQIFRDCFLNLQYHYIKTTNYDRVQGENSSDNQVIFQLHLNW